jgi:hypothetical protein
MEETYGSKFLGHLGLVAVMIGKALIINGLGFTQRILYTVLSFFEDTPSQGTFRSRP